ncbi:acyl carrier protein [Acidisphaera sp. S103]|uniref:acyl carrier protein n=1 Tax=Acidisphaera sp. S103 TaxID=1747223 RepID=UPI00131E6234|nr:acyl carrier protein [Acidisphaera sp. S103]
MTSILSRDEILARLSADLQEMFEIPAERITLEARLYEDLDLDSIDAVDLIVKLGELTGRKIKPEAFKSVRTVGDVVVCVEATLADGGDAVPYAVA